jgi:hypothetical protein
MEEDREAIRSTAASDSLFSLPRTFNKPHSARYDISSRWPSARVRRPQNSVSPSFSASERPERASTARNKHHCISATSSRLIAILLLTFSAPSATRSGRAWHLQRMNTVKPPNRRLPNSNGGRPQTSTPQTSSSRSQRSD